MTSLEAFGVERLGSRWAVTSGGAIFAYANRRDEAIRLASAAEQVLIDTETAQRNKAASADGGSADGKVH